MKKSKILIKPKKKTSRVFIIRFLLKKKLLTVNPKIKTFAINLFFLKLTNFITLGGLNFKIYGICNANILTYFSTSYNYFTIIDID